MKHITVEFSREELALLTSLAADQLFRRQFIDPKMPGYKPNPAEVGMGKALVARLRLIVDEAPRNGSAPVLVSGHGAHNSTKRPNGSPDAV